MQTVPVAEWELLVVDNASTEPVRERFRLDWHHRGRHLCEPNIGKTNAVLRAIHESQGELIVMVDDDNVLASDYLQRAQTVAERWPMLGVWGGSIQARYEEQPPEWLKPYECYLSVREVRDDQWFNLAHPQLYGNLPYGAGLCVRRPVADEYARLVQDDVVRRRLDRCGESLVSSGDTDLALVACDLRLGVGLFAALRLTHLIHKGRLTEAYMERMLREMTYSLRVLAAKRGHSAPAPGWLRSSWESIAAWRRGWRDFRFYRASLKGAKAAQLEIARWARNAQWSGAPPGVVLAGQ
jgi:glycosyltransferase involved in cell wall biosynthesis